MTQDEMLPSIPHGLTEYFPVTREIYEKEMATLKEICSKHVCEPAPVPITCRACKQSVPKPFFDMGMMPLANGFLNSPDDPEEKFPLVLCRCDNCGMVQLGHVVPRGRLYEDYSFRTSSSKTMVKHFDDLMSSVYMPCIEIGSNDGSSLATIYTSVRESSGPPEILGIDPARNLAAQAAMRGVPVIPDYFSEKLAKDIAASDFGVARSIVACNVLGHVDDLDDFLRGVKLLLHPDGKFVFEVPYLGDTIGGGQYDQLYMEHLSYWAKYPLYVLLNRHEMRIENIEHFPVHGGSIRVTARHGIGPCQFDDNEGCGLNITRFASNCEQEMLDLKNKIELMHEQGKKIIAYGASAKGSIVLNYCGIGTDLIPLVIDSTPEKWHKFMPGTHQAIVAPEDIMGFNNYDAILLLAWNHASEIKAKHPEFAGEWILPHEVQ